MSLLQMTAPLDAILKYAFKIYMFISKIFEVSVQYVSGQYSSEMILWV